MGWLVAHLVRNKDRIKETHDIDSDEYNDLLLVEAKIKELHDSGFLTDVDVCMIDLASDGRPIHQLGSYSRQTLSHTFMQLCERISYFMGGHFTDDGLIEEMRTTYSLDDDAVNKLSLYVSGRFRHNIKRNAENL